MRLLVEKDEKRIRSVNGLNFNCFTDGHVLKYIIDETILIIYYVNTYAS